MLEFTAPEGRYKIGRTADSPDPHFFIYCECGLEDGSFGGYHIKGETGEFPAAVRDHEAQRHTKYDCTFMLNEAMFLGELNGEHREETGGKTLTIVCNDCLQEFEFTRESYIEMREMMEALEKGSLDEPGV